MKYILIVFLFCSCSNGSVCNKPFVNSECNVVIDSTYKLSQNKKGKWAIIRGNSVLGYSTRYAHYGFYSYDNFEAMTFDDSCKAKGLYLKYITDIEQNSFK